MEILFLFYFRGGNHSCKKSAVFFVNSANLVEGNILLSSQSVDSIKTYKENIKEMLLKRNNGCI